MLAVFILIITAMPSSVPDLLTPFLLENTFPLDIDNLDLSPMADDLETCEVILSGALWHGTTANYELQYAMAVSLNQQAGVKYLLLEISYASSQLYNAYLQTGDEAILSRVHDSLKRTSSSNYEHRLFWEKLYQYNRALPQEDKICIVGIDLEEMPYIAVYYLSILPGVDTLSLPDYSRYPLYTPQGLSDYVSSLQENIAANETEYRQILGASYNELELVVQNLADTVQANIAKDYYAAREEIIYRNFLRAFSSNPPGKYYGQWTMEHIYQRGADTPIMGSAEKLAMYLNRPDSPVQGRVLSVSALYTESSYRLFYQRRYHFDTHNDYITDVKAFKDLARSDYTLFRLTGKDSPFSLRPYTVISPDGGGAATDYYQYMLVIKNSKPCNANK